MATSDICPVELISWITRWSKRRHAPDTRQALSCLPVIRAVALPEFKFNYTNSKQSIWSASLCPQHSTCYSSSCHSIWAVKLNCLVKWRKCKHHFIIYLLYTHIHFVDQSLIHLFVYLFILFIYLFIKLFTYAFIYLPHLLFVYIFLLNIYLFTNFFNLFTYAFTYSLRIHLSIQSLIYSYINFLVN
jgi:hypothetical protein